MAHCTVYIRHERLRTVGHNLIDKNVLGFEGNMRGDVFFQTSLIYREIFCNGISSPLCFFVFVWR